MKITRPAALFAFPAITATVFALTACSDDVQPAPEPTASTTPSATSPSSEPTETSSEETSSRTSSTSATSEGFKDASVAEVYEEYHSLAPRALFKKFKDCQPNGVPDSMACSGPEVGQFQFFSSRSKAASTTQLLTELRSSRVVEDDGNRLVGWSPVGSTAIISVVNTDEGLLLQHMVSSDEEDPEERIYELGLASESTSADNDEKDDKDASSESSSSKETTSKATSSKAKPTETSTRRSASSEPKDS